MSEVSVSRTLYGAAEFISFLTEGGELNATFRPNPGWFCISGIDVERARRRNGIAKSLLQHASTEAKALGASVIYSAITSRECLDAMTAVFGEDNISVTEVGTYTPDDERDRSDTSAMLWLEQK